MFEIFKVRKVQIGLVVITIIFMIIGVLRFKNMEKNPYDVHLSDTIVNALENSVYLTIENKKSKGDTISYEEVEFTLPSNKFKSENESVYYYERAGKKGGALRIDKIFNVYTMLVEGKYEELNAYEYDYETLFETYDIDSFTDLLKYINKNYKKEIENSMSEDEKMMIYLSNSLSVYDIKGSIYILNGSVEGFMTVNDDIFDIYLESENVLYNFTFINSDYKFATLESVKTFLESVVF